MAQSPGMPAAMRIVQLSGPLVLLALLSLGACSSPPVAGLASPPPFEPLAAPASSGAEAGLAFAQAHCAACHGVAKGQLSTVPAAPTFEEVVNKPGLTRETLTAFLRDSHNYPDIMNFEIAPESLDSLSAYMMTLRENR